MGPRSATLAALVFLMLGGLSARAQLAAIDEPEEPVRARLVSERSALVAGRVNLLGVVFEIDPEWHIYWPGLNDTGMPTTFAIDLPEGLERRDPVWPAPHRYESPGELLDHVYEETMLVMLPVFVPSTVARGERITIGASAEWLMCREACIPGWAEGLELELPVVDSPADTARTSDAELFRAARQRAPRPIGSALGAISLDLLEPNASERRTVRLRVENADRLAFYPHESSSSVRDLLDAGVRDGDSLSLTIERPNKPRTLVGVLEVWGPGDTPPSRVYRIDMPLDERHETESEESPASDAG